MKELEIKSNNDIEIQIEKKQEKAYEFVGNIVPKKGHRLFEINTITKEVKLAPFITKKTINLEDIFIGTPNVNEIIMNKDCVYISALNSKVALDRYEKNKGSATIPKGTFKLNSY